MNQPERVVVVSAVRSPFVRAQTVFKNIPPSILGGAVLREVVGRIPLDPKLIEEIYFGIVSAPAEGPNVSREALLDSGLPPNIPCTTINRYCASSSEATAGIVAKIQAGQIEIGIAGGVESISSVRALFSENATRAFQDIMKAKTIPQKLQRLSQIRPKDLAPEAPGIKEPTTGLTMGQSADLMAREFRVERKDQDLFAVESHQKAYAAWERGFYRDHVVAIATPEGKVIDRDTDVRSDSNIEKLATLKPVFYKDGTITAGNASPLTDGASALVLMTEKKAKELRLPILGAIRAVASAAIDLKREPLLIGPVYAIPSVLERAGIGWSDLHLIEMHEAFVAQCLATISAIESTTWAKDKLGLSSAIGKVDRSRLNVNGGSIALGHPFGATGARMVMQALTELRGRRQNLALLSVCAAGGLSSVMVVEAL